MITKSQSNDIANLDKILRTYIAKFMV